MVIRKGNFKNLQIEKNYIIIRIDKKSNSERVPLTEKQSTD